MIHQTTSLPAACTWSGIQNGLTVIQLKGSRIQVKEMLLNYRITLFHQSAIKSYSCSNEVQGKGTFYSKDHNL